MNIQDLKNNRAEIIAYLNENSSDTKKAMEIMARLVHPDAPFKCQETSVYSLCDSVINDYNLMKAAPSMYIDGVGYNNLSDYNRANNLKMWKNK